MKIEIGRERSPILKEEWPGQLDYFSHFEFVAGVPGVLCLITTQKDNGCANACFHAGGSFAGDKGGFFAILPGIYKETHTYQHLMRDGEFCVNFLASVHYDACLRTVCCGEKDEAADELIDAGLTAEPAKTLKAPRVAEAFLVYECKVKSITDLSGAGLMMMVVGEVLHAAVEEGSRELAMITGLDGFSFNIHSPMNPVTGQGCPTGVATLSLLKTI